MIAKEILNDFPSQEIGLNEYYRKSTVIDAMQRFANEEVKYALRWRDPKDAPQDIDMLVKYQNGNVTYDYTCLERDRDDIWHWRGNDWDTEEYPIIGWRPIE